LAGAESIHVSALPTGSAVRFYLSGGGEPANPVHATPYTDDPTTSTSSALSADFPDEDCSQR